MAPAGRLDDRRGPPFSVVKGIEPGERIGLHDADIAGEMLLGILASRGWRLTEDRRWRILAARQVDRRARQVQIRPVTVFILASTGTVVSSAWMVSALRT